MTPGNLAPACDPETCFLPCWPQVTAGSTEDICVESWVQCWARGTDVQCPLAPSLENTPRRNPWTHPKRDLGGTPSRHRRSCGKEGRLSHTHTRLQFCSNTTCDPLILTRTQSLHWTGQDGSSQVPVSRYSLGLRCVPCVAWWHSGVPEGIRGETGE